MTTRIGSQANRLRLATLALLCAASHASVALADDSAFATPAIRAGRHDTVLLRDDGSVWGCASAGNNTDGIASGNYTVITGTEGFPAQQLPPYSTRYISAGWEHAFADALAAGSNSYGQLGQVFPADSLTYIPAPPISARPVAGNAVTRDDSCGA